jgi:hypothetical protein
VNGNSAWSEFHWDFHATLRKDGSAVTTHGVETQVYRKEAGKWFLVHVHSSEDRQPTLLRDRKRTQEIRRRQDTNALARSKTAVAKGRTTPSRRDRGTRSHAIRQFAELVRWPASPPWPTGAADRSLEARLLWSR